MKNLKNYIGIGLIGLGSLSVFGQYGGNKNPRMIEIVDKDNNKIPEEYNLWEKENNKSITLKRYLDKDQNGEVDSMMIFIYSSEYEKVFAITKEIVMPMEIPEMKMANCDLPIGKSFFNCKEGYFKKDIYDYIKK